MTTYAGGELWALAIGSCILGTFLFWGISEAWEYDNYDIDDVGEYMCEKHGLAFVDAEVTNIPDTGKIIDDLKITCQEINEKLIDDGYLVVLGK